MKRFLVLIVLLGGLLSPHTSIAIPHDAGVIFVCEPHSVSRSLHSSMEMADHCSNKASYQHIISPHDLAGMSHVANFDATRNESLTQLADGRSRKAI